MSSSLFESFRRSLFAIAACLTIGACSTQPVLPPLPPTPELPPAPHQLAQDTPQFLTLPNTPDGATPVRVGVILPLDNTNANVRALAKAMMRAAELALYDSGNKTIILMTAEDTGTPADAAAAAQKLLGEAPKSSSGRCSPARSKRSHRSRAIAACRSWPSPPTAKWRAMASICSVSSRKTRLSASSLMPPARAARRSAP
jgi:hypothetical protein